MTTLLYVVNQAEFFLSHRLPLALAARTSGYKVHVATGKDSSPNSVYQISQLGFTHHPLKLTRTGKDPINELFSIEQLYALYTKIKPDLIHHVTIKPILYGGIAARMLNIPSVFAVSGLGHMFIHTGIQAGIFRQVIITGLRLSLGGKKACTIFQNEDDRSLFLKRVHLRVENTVLIRGSGVDTSFFIPSDEPPGEPLVLFPSRLLTDKGIHEFVRAARTLKARGVEARFVLVGNTDKNPASVTKNQVLNWVQEGVVEWWGFREDMNEVFKRCHLVCLPSYREGLPKALIEAAASARAIVTTDVPGCRDVVKHKKNGLLVPAKNSQALADALYTLLSDQKLRQEMGAFSRKMAEEEFELSDIVKKHLSLYAKVVSH